MKQLENWIPTFFPSGRLQSHWDLAGGISTRMVGFAVEFESAKVEKYVLRQPGDWDLKNNPKAAECEFLLLDKLADVGIPVPEVVYLDQEGKDFGRPGLVLRYVDGTVDLKPENPEDRLKQMADQLLLIHQTAFDCSFVNYQIDLPGNTWFGDDSIYKRGHEILSAHWPELAGVKTQLLHGDFWPGNLLWNDGRLAAVIDWGDACMGDPLMDLAIARLDVLWAFDIDAMERFTESFCSDRSICVEQLAVWDIYAAMRPEGHLDIWAGAFPKLGRDDVTSEVMEQKRRAFLERAIMLL
ncbi:MAG: phosphotransferase [Verrucomicrobiales bacterium]|nr:phosphotransferase [Verrucomicrobiales bacterium]